MPLPWKKAKVTRISRIVADLQSPKRGGSLVVETGFPTSLIDLFVKNRDRLKKPSNSKKKKKKDNKKVVSHVNDSNQVETDAPTPDPITANSESGSEKCSVRGEPICGGVENLPSEPTAEEIVESIEASVPDPESATRDESRGEDEFVGGGALLMAVLKVFLVVVLALSTKKLVVGVTLSAFLLLFLEYVGKSSVRFLRPCSKMEVRLRSMVNWVSSFIWSEKDYLVLDVKDQEQNYAAVAELLDRIDLTSSNDEEIEVSELNNDLSMKENEFLNDGPELELLSRDKKWGYLNNTSVKKENSAVVAMEDGETFSPSGETMEKNKSSKRSKIKAKIIKNLVPKKLRSSKYSKSKSKEDIVNMLETCSEVSSYYEVEEQEEQRFESIKGSFCHDGISSLDGVEVALVSEGEEKVETVVEEENPKMEGNCVYLTLVLVVLAGLFGGRIVALLLSISWCFMLKLIGTRWRSINMRLARSPFSFSSQ
ncbi:uncharacterized protein LOC133802474 [Humulus lupulus]|uniref:uncharacterized protein LOC133802474 n=1 Tax=Humulus lupulus TaxID=3486 RepID=UPI002B402982|nr:uncharacterized protein LOC133802474 [Humulus lupulus]